MKIFYYILTIFFFLSCSDQRALERIEIQLDKETLNPVRNPGERGTIRIIGCDSKVIHGIFHCLM